MDFNQIMSIALVVIYVVVGLALLWLIIELIRFVRRTHRRADELHRQIEPTLIHLENIAASLEPTAKKIDPLVDRVSLTVDAANLEIMRLDQILENVSDITDSASSAVSAVDNIASAPINLVNNVADKVRGMFKEQGASDESVALGQKKAEEARGELQAGETAAHTQARTPKQIGSEEQTPNIHQSKDAEDAALNKQAAVDFFDQPESTQGYFTYENIFLEDEISSAKAAADSASENAVLPKQEVADEAFRDSSASQDSQRALTLGELARMAQAEKAKTSGEVSRMGE